MMQNLYNEMTELLRKQAPDFFANDKLNKNKVTDAAYSYDGSLLKVLLNNASLKKQFYDAVLFATLEGNKTKLENLLNIYEEEIVKFNKKSGQSKKKKR